MFGGLDDKDLIALRLELLYAAQKVQTAFVALVSRKYQEGHSRNYNPDQMKASKLEIEHAEFMLRTAARNLLPTFEALAQEGVKTT